MLRISGSAVVIEVGGIGFSVQLTPAHALCLRLGQEARVVTSLIVREDSLALFGFADHDALDIFTLLCGVTGVGPKSAIGVLAELSPNEIALAVSREDDTVFRRVSGIGPKTAKLIILSLTGKVTPVLTSASQVTGQAASASTREDVLEALVGLGWNDRAAQFGLDAVLERATPNDAGSVQSLLRLALTELGPRNAGGAR